MNDIPIEILDMILSNLSKEDAISVTSTNRLFRQFYSKFVVRQLQFSIKDLSLMYNLQLNLKLSDVTVLREVDENNIDMITSSSFPNLRVLQFSEVFNLPISKYDLPNSLKEITFGTSYEHPLHMKTKSSPYGIPLNVKIINCISPNNNKITVVNSLPEKLKQLYVTELTSFQDSNGNPILPNRLKVLMLRHNNNYTTPLIASTGKLLFPQSLQALFLGKLVLSNQLLSCLKQLCILKTLLINIKLIDRFYDDKGESLFPDSIKHLKLVDVGTPALYNTQGVSICPPKLKSLHLDFYDHPLPNLKHLTTLTTVEIKKGFNHPIENLLPDSVKTLCLYDLFNQPIQNSNGESVLPSNLKEVYFGTSFNQEIQNSRGESVLPSNLNTIQFGNSFDKQIQNSKGESVLPPNLTVLRLYGELNQEIQNSEGKSVLPSNLTVLKLYQNINQKIQNSKGESLLPSSLKTLRLCGHFNQEIQNSEGKSVLPPNLTILKLHGHFNQQIYNQEGKSVLPSGIKTLKFGYIFNQDIQNSIGESMLPSSLETLTFGKFFNQDIQNSKGESMLPSGIKKLRFGKSFNKEIQNSKGEPILPSNLKTLTFGKSFNQEIQNSKGEPMLPSSLETLHFGESFDKQIKNSKGESVLPIKILSLSIN